MTMPSQFDPLAEAPRSLRGRIARKLGRTIEPMAVRLLAWCRSLDHRVATVERRLEGDEAQIRALAHAVRSLDSIDRLAATVEAMGEEFGELERRTRTAAEAAEARLAQAETRIDQSFWGREALVERMNRDDLREEQAVARLAAVEQKAEQIAWGREALVERMNRDAGVVEAIDGRLAALQAKVDEQVPLPLSFGLDYLAMGRRLAALEDQIEALLSHPGQAQEVRSATLVAFTGTSAEKAAG